MLLRTLRFDLIAEQPLRYLLNFCRLLHCSHAVNKLAVCLACPSVDGPRKNRLCMQVIVSLLPVMACLLAKLMREYECAVIISTPWDRIIKHSTPACACDAANGLRS